MEKPKSFYSHVNYSVTKISCGTHARHMQFYSHVNYSVTKIHDLTHFRSVKFYSHVNYSVTKMPLQSEPILMRFTVT